MPANLPPEYYKIEAEYREATTPEAKIRYLEEMMSVIPKHKGTDHLRADLRKKLSRLKMSAEQRKGGGRQVSPYVIDHEGAGQVAVIGPPNVGKSSLVRALTNATPDVAQYPYTTTTPVPGMMRYENIQIQLIDTPPLSREFEDAQLLDLIRRADMLLLVVDMQSTTMEQIEEGIALLTDNHIIPQNMADDFTHVERRLYIKPLLVLVNKTDDETLDEDFAVLCELLGGETCPLLPFSAEAARYVDRFKQAVFERLNVMRIFSKPPGRDYNPDQPFVMPQGSTVGEFAGKVHKDFEEGLKSARVWGSGVYEGQMVGRDHVLHDGDVVELRL